jgi:hypothetical protein
VGTSAMRLPAARCCRLQARISAAVVNTGREGEAASAISVPTGGALQVLQVSSVLRLRAPAKVTIVRAGSLWVRAGCQMSHLITSHASSCTPAEPN